MNKLSIATAVTLASIAFVSAEEINVKKPVQVKPTAVKQMMKQEGRDIQMPNIKTGDPDTDAQLKTLNDEMEVKIKAIRDEYVLKIRAIIGSKASSTVSRMMRDENGEKKGFDEGRKMGVPFASSTASTTNREVRGVMRVQDDNENKTIEAPSRLMNFFRGMFGGNR